MEVKCSFARNVSDKGQISCCRIDAEAESCKNGDQTVSFVYHFAILEHACSHTQSIVSEQDIIEDSLGWR